MKKNTLLLTFLFVFSAFFINAQNTKPITFQGVTITMPPNIKNFKTDQLASRTATDFGNYVILQFEKTPNQNVQNNFRRLGIELNDYISNNSYFTIIPNNISENFLENSGVISVVDVPEAFKVSSRIQNEDIGEWAKDGDHILVHLLYHKSFGSQTFLAELQSISGISVNKDYKGSNLMELSVPMDKISQLANLTSVKWIELIPEPGVKEDTGGRSIHRASNLDTQTLSGRNYTGEGVGVMVRDDGIVGPHIDFQGRIDNSNASGSGQTHGDGVAGIMAGAGNLDPTKRGMAAGANIYVVNYVGTHLDNPTTSLINNGDVQITNSSYGDGCNGGYTINSNTVDTQSNNNPELLHVYSAGNSGSSNCNYGAGSGWGNITGGHKQGKNVIATANVYADGSLVSHSSRGPAKDGRIKPDITAHGQGQLSTDENNAYLSFGGTSGAAPGIAGVSAQLYQLYKDKNGGQFPNASLIKATLLNTANDHGNEGPDFKFGWGIVNGLRAAMLLEDDRYLESEISQGENNDHVINIPANTTQVRFMVYWNDPAGVAGASKALVNDLDLKVTSPSNAEVLPWVLDHSPNAASLDAPATRGADHLNNMEQVLINNPEAGDYTIDISGFDIPVGPQKYFIVYEVIAEELTLTYPNGSENLVPGEAVTIHWDAVNTTDGFSLEYSVDNGSTWTNISDVSPTSSNYSWTVPDNLSGESLVRITSGSFSDQSDEPFSIAPLVSGINISKICPDAITVSWDALNDATSYEVYLLGDKYMDSMGTTSGTSFDIPITDPEQSFWVAVSAKGGATNWSSRRSIAINHAGGVFNCPLSKNLSLKSLDNDFSNMTIICSGITSYDIIANIANEGTDAQSNFNVSYQLNSNAPVVESFSGSLDPGTETAYTFTTQLEITQNMNNTLKVWVTLEGDQYEGNDDYEESFYSQVLPDEINEIHSFESTAFPLPGWNIDNPDGNLTWVPRTVNVGADGNETNAVFIDNYSYNASGQTDSFTTRIYDLGGSGLTLNFDLAKAQYSANSQDGLRVEISLDCGDSYTSIYEKNNADLSTISGFASNNWVPTSETHWRRETIDLGAYEGQQAMFRFVNLCDYGNTTLIDNIEVSGSLSTKENNFDNYFSLFPNPANDRFIVRSRNANFETIKVFDLLGKIVKDLKIKDTRQIVDVNIGHLPTGIYVVRIESETGAFFKKIVKN